DAAVNYTTISILVGDTSRIVRINGISGDGDIGIGLNAAGITDNAGNALSTAGDSHISESFTIDKIRPTATLASNDVSPGSRAGTNANLVSFDVVFSESINPGTFTDEDVIVLASGVDYTSLSIAADTPTDSVNFTVTL